MAREPIDEVKVQLRDIQTLCDDMMAHINQSNQAKASARLQEIEQNLDKIKDRLRREFGWLAPQQPAPMKKSRLGF